MKKPFHRHILNPTPAQIDAAYLRQRDGEWQSVQVVGNVLNYQVVKGRTAPEEALAADLEAQQGRLMSGNSDPALRRVPRAGLASTTAREAAGAYQEACTRISMDGMHLSSLGASDQAISFARIEVEDELEEQEKIDERPERAGPGLGIILRSAVIAFVVSLAVFRYLR